MRKEQKEGENMYLDREAISLAEAQAKLAAIELPEKSETIKVSDALGYILAESVSAPFPQPQFRRSGMDGYAITAADDHDYPLELTLAAEVPAGETYDQPLAEGTTVRIMTGAAVPENAAKVIVLETTEKTADGKVRFLKAGKNDNITPIGTEFSEGEVLLEKGQTINPGVISLLSAFGFEECQVYAKPRIAILTTGSELLKPGQPHEPGKIYNSNGPLLQALVAQNGAELHSIGTVPDTLAELQAELERLSQAVDLILTVGGVSVGDFDFVAVAAKESGGFLFNKLAMRPGSPTTAFIYNGTPVIGLSGNPSACFTGFYLFAEPMIRRFQGQGTKVLETQMILTHDYPRTNKFDKYLRATWEEKDGQKYVTLVGSDQSSTLGNLPQTTAFFKVPHDTSLTAGTEVTVLCLPYK